MTWTAHVLAADTAKYELPLCVLHTSLPWVPVVVCVVVPVLVSVVVPVELGEDVGDVDVVAVVVPEVDAVGVVVPVVEVSEVVGVDVPDVVVVGVVEVVGVVVCDVVVVSEVVPVDVGLDVAVVLVVAVDVPVVVTLDVGEVVGVVISHSVNVPSWYELIAAFSTATAALHESASSLVDKKPPSAHVNGLATSPREYSAMVAASPSSIVSPLHWAASISSCWLSKVVHFTEFALSTHVDSTAFSWFACTAQLVTPFTAM